MKSYKVLLILQLVLMYLAHLPFYILIILVRIPMADEVVDKLFPTLLLGGIIATALILPLCLVNAIFAVISLIRGSNNPSKTTMIVKLALIPWYIINFMICCFLISGFLNPFLMLAAPIVLCILVGITYLLMVSTSLFDIAYIINKMIRKEIKEKGLIITSLIFLFFFTFDVLGSIILHFKTKQIKESIE